MESWSAIAFARDWAGPPRLQNAPSLALRPHRPVALREGASPTTTRCRRATPGWRHGPHDGPAGAGRAQRLAALLPAVRPEPARGRARRPERPGAKTDDEIVAARRRAAEVERSCKFAVEDPDAAGELAARLVHLARQRADGQRQGPRVLPEALPRHAPQRRSPRTSPRTPCSEVVVARDGAAGQDGPGRRPQLPHGHVGALLRHRAARGHLVREGRPQLDRHALVHPPAVGGGAAVLGVEERLGHLQGDREAASRELAAKHLPGAGRATSSRRRSRTTRRPRSPSRESQDWSTGECEADPRQDDAGARRRRRATTRTSTTSSSRSGRWSARTASARTARTTTVDGRLRRDGRARRRRRDVGRRSATRRSRSDEDACDAILHLATVTNGELAYRSYQNMEEKTGLPLADLAEGSRGVRDHLRGPPGAAAAAPQQPDVVRAHRRTAAPTRPSPTTWSGSCPGGR